ncbi:LuxR C-terminal-related transcriptional regulator [Cognatiyoonia sp. IB215446]|uniref:helix-turn-helix transcriptional regulator n=1 Tax=Cognatiyoonia sp. IB215446 TaxID=3097355 RepID=UPI002A1243D8|nr:LuxR C-terminal-related transcriptional regulator [Cognatiyoonia sp. IB215446]MDX8346914.1 LuxR C-terminal-related transcriptional regulator [Cognatiyoonia sp. IB215446]
MQVRLRFILSAAYLAVYMLVELLAEIAVNFGGIWEELAWSFWNLPWGYLNAVIALILGWEAIRLFRSMNAMDTQLKASAAAFQSTVSSYAKKWRLSDAEKDVLMLILKGCTQGQIAEMRKTAEGTVKAQAARIYQKSGFNNKNELLSTLVEDLSGGHSVL